MLRFMFRIDDAVVDALVTKLPDVGVCYCPTYDGVALSGGHKVTGEKIDDVFVLERIVNPGNYERHTLIIQPDERA